MLPTKMNNLYKHVFIIFTNIYHQKWSRISKLNDVSVNIYNMTPYDLEVLPKPYLGLYALAHSCISILYYTTYQSANN